MQRPSGMFAFSIVWLGQVVSLLGSAMTQFALTIWVWQETGQATQLALVGFFAFGPTVFLSPLAGALVDRLNRKLVMMLSDLGAGVASIIMLLLISSNQLEVWHLYILAAWVGAFSAFQFPAYSAAISTMIDKSQYARANGMLSLADESSRIAAPVLAGGLIAFLGLRGILIIDIVSFSFAILMLFLVAIPQPKQQPDAQQSKPSLWQDSLFGFRFMLEKRPLLHLQLVFLAINFTSTFSTILLAPLILARTLNNELILGSVQSSLGVGGVVGGLLLSLWGGPKRKIHGVLIGMAMSGLCGSVLLGVGQDLRLWLLGGFFFFVSVPILNGSNQAIWQAKVPLEHQGKVFAARRLIAQITAPLAMLLAGPLADNIFEPLMLPDKPLAQSLGWLVGTGEGAGIGLIMVLFGLLSTLVGLGAYLVPSVRNVETLLPDHDQLEPET